MNGWIVNGLERVLVNCKLWVDDNKFKKEVEI